MLTLKKNSLNMELISISTAVVALPTITGLLVNSCSTLDLVFTKLLSISISVLDLTSLSYALVLKLKTLVKLLKKSELKLLSLEVS